MTGPGEVPLSTILNELGRAALPVPHPFARGLLNVLWKSRFTSFPVPELDHIRYVCMVDGRRADMGVVNGCNGKYPPYLPGSPVNDTVDGRSLPPSLRGSPGVQGSL